MGDPSSNKPGLSAAHVHAIGAAVCLAVAAGAWFAVVAPAWHARAQSDRQRLAIDSERAEIQGLRTQVIQFERRLAQTHRQEQESPLRLDPVARINARLKWLSDVAVTRGLRVTGTKIGDVMPRARFDVVPIRLQGDGTYRDVAQFLHEVHTQFPDMGVAYVNLAVQSRRVDGSGTFDVVLAWYAAPGPRRPTAEADASP